MELTARKVQSFINKSYKEKKIYLNFERCKMKYDYNDNNMKMGY